MSKITVLEHLKTCSEAARIFVEGLMSELAKTTVDAINEMEEVKADKPKAVSVTIPVSGWKSDSSGDYPKYYDILTKDAAIGDRTDIVIAPSSLKSAKSCGLCPTSETLAGIIRIRATSVPSENISAEYIIEKGKE